MPLSQFVLRAVIVTVGATVVALALTGVYSVTDTNGEVTYKINKLTGTVWLCRAMSEDCQLLEYDRHEGLDA